MLRAAKSNNPPLSGLNINKPNESQIKPVGYEDDVIVISDDDDDDARIKKRQANKRKNPRGKRKAQTPSRVLLIPNDILEILTSDDDERVLERYPNKKKADESENVQANGSGEGNETELYVVSACRLWFIVSRLTRSRSLRMLNTKSKLSSERSAHSKKRNVTNWCAIFFFEVKLMLQHNFERMTGSLKARRHSQL